MRIKLDENLPAELVEDLAAMGHDADTVASEGLAGFSDHRVVRAASSADRVLFTLDKGIGDVRRHPLRHHAGVVLFHLRRQGPRAVRVVVLDAIARLIDDVGPGRLVVVSEAAIRTRG